MARGAHRVPRKMGRTARTPGRLPHSPGGRASGVSSPDGALQAAGARRAGLAGPGCAHGEPADSEESLAGAA
eukprot:11227393-Lingulodinium_polyedra.AAC.1